jgi:hypothetical protein
LKLSINAGVALFGSAQHENPPSVSATALALTTDATDGAANYVAR